MSIPQGLAREIRSVLGDNYMGYRSVAEYVLSAVRKDLRALMHTRAVHAQLQTGDRQEQGERSA